MTNQNFTLTNNNGKIQLYIDGVEIHNISEIKFEANLYCLPTLTVSCYISKQTK